MHTNKTYKVAPFLKIEKFKNEENRDEYYLDVHPQNARLKVENSKLLDCIVALPKTFKKSDLPKYWSKILDQEELIEEVWNLLIKIEAIVPTRNYHKLIQGFTKIEFKIWNKFLNYHLSVRDFPFLDMGISDSFLVDNEIMKSYDSKEVPPSAYQDFDTGKGLSLTFIENIFNNNLPLKEGANIQSLTLLLDVAFGERSRCEKNLRTDNYLEMEKLLKAVPSGGGRHPSECFVVNNNMDGLATGLFHYNTRGHHLSYLGSADQLISILGHQTNFSLIVAPVLERAMWRYREPRSYRAVLVDIGHIVGSLNSIGDFCGLNCNLRTDINCKQVTMEMNLNPNTQPTMAILSFNERKQI